MFPSLLWLLYLLVVGVVFFAGCYLVPRKDQASPSSAFWGKYLLAAVIWALPLLCIRFGISAEWRPANFIAITLAFIAWIYFSFASFSIRPRKLGILIGSLLTGPIIFLVLLLPFSFLGVAFIASDIAQGYETTTMPNGFTCQSQITGTAFTESVQTFELLRPVLGAMRVRVLKKVYSPVGNPDRSNKQECPDLLKEYESSAKE